MRALVREAGLEDRILIESAGMGDWHVGELRDVRARAAGKRGGLALEGTAQQLSRADFDRFDYLIAMDAQNLRDMKKLAPDDGARARIRLLRSFEAGAAPDAEVPDPYYGGEKGFDEVVAICKRACRGLLDTVRREHGL